MSDGIYECSPLGLNLRDYNQKQRIAELEAENLRLREALEKIQRDFDRTAVGYYDNETEKTTFLTASDIATEALKGRPE